MAEQNLSNIADIAGPTAAPSNPMDAASNALGLKQKVNEVNLFQATFQAKQIAGQIIANAPDPESAMKQLQSNPLVNAFAPEVFQQYASTHNVIMTGEGLEAGLKRDAYHTFVSNLPRLAADPSQFDNVAKDMDAMSAPSARKSLATSMARFKQSMEGKNPEQLAQFFAGTMISNGDGARLPELYGQFNLVHAGNVDIPTRVTQTGQVTGQAPGSVEQGKGEVVLGTAPQLATDKAINFAGTKGKVQGTVPANPLSLAAPAPRQGPVNQLSPTQPAPAAPAAPASPFQAPEAKTAPLARDNTPLIPKGYSMKGKAPTTAVKTIAGNPTGPLADLNDQNVKDLGTKGKTQFENAQQTAGSLHEMGQDYDVMEKGGGFQVPGTGADFRNSLAKLDATVADIAGTEPHADLRKIAAADDFAKATERMGGTVLNTLYGDQREAAETIKRMTEHGVPGISHTYLGGKFMISMLQAMADRSMDRYEWDQQWIGENSGNLTGSDVAFGKAHPITQYVDRALAENGLDMKKKGFATRADMDRALKAKLITPAQAEAIRKNQGAFPENMPKE